MKKFFQTFIILITVFFEINSFADYYNFDELLIPVGVRSCGLAGNFVAGSDTAEGLFYNPSVSVMCPYGEFAFAHHIYYAGSTLQQFACTFPLGSFGFGLTGRMVSTPEVNVIKNFQLYDDKFNSVLLSSEGLFGVKLSKNIGIGFGTKYVERKIYLEKTSGLLYSMGLLFATNNEVFTLGCSILDYSLEEKYPTSILVGTKLKLDIPQQQAKINLFASAKVDYHTKKTLYSFGIEHWGSEVLGLRVGYVYDTDKTKLGIYDQLSFFSAGISLKIGNFGIDYAYLPNSVLGTTHNVGINIRFKTKKEIKQIQLPCNVIVEPLCFSPNNDGYFDNIFFHNDITTYTNIVELCYTIRNEKEEPVFVFSSTNVSASMVNFYTYDGKDTYGKVLDDGKYTVELMLKDKSEDKLTVYKSQKTEFVVDTQPPMIDIKLSTTSFSPDGDNINDIIEFMVDIKDETSSVDNVDVGIYTLQNKKVYSYKIDLSTPQQTLSFQLQWDGKDEIYNQVVPNAEYKLLCNAKDVAYNKSFKEITFEVYIPPKEPQKIVEKVVEKQEKLFYIKGAKVTLEERGIVITYPTDELFIKETGEINPKFYDSLNSLAEIIKESFTDKKIYIEGHTDSVGDENENKKKSSVYAWSVYSYFVKTAGLDGKQFEVKGLGEERPVASNKSKLGRAQNRRVEIIISK